MTRQKLATVAGVLTLAVFSFAQSSTARPAKSQLKPVPAAVQPAPTSQPASTGSASQPASTETVSEILKNLNLTSAQQPKVDRIQANAAAKIRDVLSAPQLQQLDAVSKQGTIGTDALKSLNLSAEQKTKLDAVQMSVAQELFSVLTPEQQQKLIDQMITRSNRKQSP